MKRFLAVLCSLALTLTLVGQAPAKKSSADDKSAKSEEPPPKIEGFEISRGAAGFMGLQVVDGNFKLSFYDAKKKPAQTDMVRAALRWNPKYQKQDERVILERSGDGKSLTSPRAIRPPHAFKLFITLFKEPAAGADPEAAENYVVDFEQ
jgi:hypothetical protein